MWKQAAVASAMNLLDNKLKTSERAQAQRYASMMSNTAYQRAMRDMRKAGLNPILAGKYGGASTPSVAQANVGVRTGEFLNQVTSSKKALEEIPKLKEETATIKQSREFAQEIHQERWQKLSATMGADNVIATAIATLHGVNLGDIIQQSPGSFISEKQIEMMVEHFQAYKSKLETESQGIKAIGSDIINTGKQGFKFLQRKAKTVADMINDAMEDTKLMKQLRESLNK